LKGLGLSAAAKSRQAIQPTRLQGTFVRWFIALLALIGLLSSAAALREHYRTGTSPCSINDKWDCGIVNKSPESVIVGIPVADIGIVGYLLLGVLAVKKAWRSLVAAAGPAFMFRSIWPTLKLTSWRSGAFTA
jgi:uncharacterized membrane protein